MFVVWASFVLCFALSWASLKGENTRTLEHDQRSNALLGAYFAKQFFGNLCFVLAERMFCSLGPFDSKVKVG